MKTWQLPFLMGVLQGIVILAPAKGFAYSAGSYRFSSPWHVSGELGGAYVYNTARDETNTTATPPHLTIAFAQTLIWYRKAFAFHFFAGALPRRNTGSQKPSTFGLGVHLPLFRINRWSFWQRVDWGFLVFSLQDDVGYPPRAYLPVLATGASWTFPGDRYFLHSAISFFFYPNFFLTAPNAGFGFNF